MSNKYGLILNAKIPLLSISINPYIFKHVTECGSVNQIAVYIHTCKLDNNNIFCVQLLVAMDELPLKRYHGRVWCSFISVKESSLIIKSFKQSSTLCTFLENHSRESAMTAFYRVYT